MVKPIDLMIVGAHKAGTTSLLRYLGMHKEVCIHPQSEMTFFVRDEEYQLGYENIFGNYFKNCHNASLIMAKNVGIMYSTEASKRLKEHNPDIHIVVVLRNPIDRAYSAYWYARRKGWERLKSFEQAINIESERLREDSFKWRHCAYLERGIYHKYISMLLEYFGKNHVHIFLLEDLKTNPGDICQKIYTLFNMDFTFHVNSHHNKAAIAKSEKIAAFLVSKNPLKKLIRSMIPDKIAFSVKKKIMGLNEKSFIPTPINPETRVRLSKYFQTHNGILGNIIGRNLDHWND
ncbi:MAG TPA: sulfotransferase domain-containing protein [Candidatus Brocadiaceae bacterium]